jgi:hypothetical protein
LCGRDAECEVRNHSPVCKCRDGYEGKFKKVSLLLQT